MVNRFGQFASSGLAVALNFETWVTMHIENTANENRRVVIVGASDKPDRYAYKALIMLKEHGFPVFPVHPRLVEIESIAVISDVSQIGCTIDTVTLYVNPSVGATLADALVKLNPKRVIFNPGSECPPLVATLESAGIAAIEACTLVMLQTGQF